MTWLRSLLGSDDSCPTRPATARFCPTLTDLEAREVPAVIVDFRTAPSPGSTEQFLPYRATHNGMLSFGDDAANTVYVITDNGSGSVGNLDIKVYERADYEARGAANAKDLTPEFMKTDLRTKAFSGVDIAGDRGGFDRVTYNMPRGVLPGGVVRTSSLNLGSPYANDGNVVEFNSAGVGAGSTLNLNVRGGGSGDDITATVNGVGVGGTLTVTASGGWGDDRMEVELHGTLADNSRTSIAMQGEYGRDTVHVDAWDSVAVGSGAVFTSNLAGYTHSNVNGDDLENNVSLWYLGRMNGNLQFHLGGGSRGDELQANLWFNHDSTGWVGYSGIPTAAALRGGEGHDHLRMYVRGAGIWWNTPLVDGGGGTDVYHRVSAANESWSFAQLSYDSNWGDGSGVVRNVDREARDY